MRKRVAVQGRERSHVHAARRHHIGLVKMCHYYYTLKLLRCNLVEKKFPKLRRQLCEAKAGRGHAYDLNF